MHRGQWLKLVVSSSFFCLNWDRDAISSFFCLNWDPDTNLFAHWEMVVVVLNSVWVHPGEQNITTVTDWQWQCSGRGCSLPLHLSAWFLRSLRNLLYRSKSFLNWLLWLLIGLQGLASQVGSIKSITCWLCWPCEQAKPMFGPLWMVSHYVWSLLMGVTSPGVCSSNRIWHELCASTHHTDLIFDRHGVPSTQVCQVLSACTQRRFNPVSQDALGDMMLTLLNGK